MIALFFIFWREFCIMNTYTYLLDRPTGLFRVNVTVKVINTEN